MVLCFFFFLLEFKLTEGRYCLKYPQNTENRQSKADISGLTKFLKQQDRQVVQSYHYVGGYIF